MINRFVNVKDLDKPPRESEMEGRAVKPHLPAESEKDPPRNIGATPMLLT
jgi:hypothetical protein